VQMESSNVMANGGCWIDSVIASLKVNKLCSLSIAELEVGEKLDAVVEVGKLVGSSTYGDVYVEFDGNVKGRDEQKKDEDVDRRHVYEVFYSRIGVGYCSVKKHTNIDDCMASINDDSSINIAVWANLKVDDGNERKQLIGAVTFRSISKNRLILVSEIAVKLAEGWKCQTKHLLSFLLSLMCLVHVHLYISPKPEDFEYQLPAQDLVEMLDVYPYMFISEVDDRELKNMLTELSFVKWDRFDYFNDKTLQSEAKIRAKDGNKVLMLRRGEFFSSGEQVRQHELF
jgi:hypothetical protein